MTPVPAIRVVRDGFVQPTSTTYPGILFLISEDIEVSDTNERVWPTGLTVSEAEELHKHVIDGTRVFFVISAIAHALVYSLSPWLG